VRRFMEYLPFICCSVLVIGLFIFGPIHQFSDYHAFADQTNFGAIPHAADVLSNLGFALVAIWAAWSVWPARSARSGLLSPKLPSQTSYSSTTALHSKQALWSVKSVALNLFIFGLFATALGSGYYHWAPDNMRLFWDRLPIVLTCAGLLGAAHSDSVQASRHSRSFFPLVMFVASGVASVMWWSVTDYDGKGDLRWYLMFQFLPLLLIPIWHSIYPTPKRTRWLFAIALLIYVVAKAAEIHDHAIYTWSGFITGHTLKHLLASVAAALIAYALIGEETAKIENNNR
jgi:hypothetical protein